MPTKCVSLELPETARMVRGELLNVLLVVCHIIITSLHQQTLTFRTDGALDDGAPANATAKV